mmetsp:Transcript_8923/g.14965  ORF Transcript_8923/g.14965 Transcript_8923/m.14965 type:complete len:98 (-) Transcript_8923:123-416(-)
MFGFHGTNKRRVMYCSTSTQGTEDGMLHVAVANNVSLTNGAKLHHLKRREVKWVIQFHVVFAVFVITERANDVSSPTSLHASIRCSRENNVNVGALV